MPYLYSKRWSNKIKSGNEMMYGKSNMTSLAGLSKPSTLCMLLFQYFKSSHSSWNTLVHLFWPWACSVSRGPRSLMAAWFVWETTWPAGLGKSLSLSTWLDDLKDLFQLNLWFSDILYNLLTVYHEVLCTSSMQSCCRCKQGIFILLRNITTE